MADSQIIEPVDQAILGRRSCDSFRAQRPDDQILLEALSLARWAPNHKLTEPWRFYLLGEETRAAIVDLNTRLVREKKGEEAATIKRSRWSAIPGFLVVTCERAGDPLTAREDYAATSCAIQNLALALHARGIGIKWTTGPVTRHSAFYDLLWLDPDLEEVVGLIWYGYPDSDAAQASRRPLSQVLTVLP